MPCRSARRAGWSEVGRVPLGSRHLLITSPGGRVLDRASLLMSLAAGGTPEKGKSARSRPPRGPRGPRRPRPGIPLTSPRRPENMAPSRPREGTMRYTTLGEGFVTRRPDGPGPGAVAAGPRCVELSGGELLCTCALTAALGTNDFATGLFRSADGGATWHEEGVVWPGLRRRWVLFTSVS